MIEIKKFLGSDGYTETTDGLLLASIANSF